MRLFFALELPTDVQSKLGGLVTDGGRDYRRVSPELMHLTLAFLGEQSEARLGALERIGQDAARATEPGLLRLGHAGHFGPARAPRVLWVDLDGDLNALSALQHALAECLRRDGFATEERPFQAHITLARRRERASGGPPVGWPPRVPAAQFKLDQLTLMQSRLSPHGPTYTPLLQFPLGG